MKAGRVSIRSAPRTYAKSAGIEIVEEYYDEAVSGADMIDTRPGFAAMLERLLSNGVRTIIVETANRFARDLMVQEVGYAMLKERGIDADRRRQARRLPRRHADLGDDPADPRLGPQFEKAMLVSKLRGARERKRATGVKVEGRKSHAEARPEVVALAKQLRRKHLSLREISAELFAAGHTTKLGKPFTPQSIANMLD